MFTEKIENITYNVVATIVVKYFIEKVIATVRQSWTDDDGQLQKKKINNVLQFMESPLNILFATELSESMKDDEV